MIVYYRSTAIPEHVWKAQWPNEFKMPFSFWLDQVKLKKEYKNISATFFNPFPSNEEETGILKFVCGK